MKSEDNHTPGHNAPKKLHTSIGVGLAVFLLTLLTYLGYYYYDPDHPLENDEVAGFALVWLGVVMLTRIGINHYRKLFHKTAPTASAEEQKTDGEKKREETPPRRITERKNSKRQRHADESRINRVKRTRDQVNTTGDDCE